MFERRPWRYIGITIFTSMSIFAGYVYFSIYFNLRKQIKHEVEPSKNEVYFENMKAKFIASYEVAKDLNENIEKDFYIKENYDNIVSTGNNVLEISWKSRMLFESTPLGNVIMFYDAYKQGFSYYADDIIPYNVLNAVAMKYVLHYFCRDFFIDNSIVPAKHESPFLHVHEIDAIKTIDSKKIDMKNGPFAKLKNYEKNNPNKRKPLNNEKMKKINDSTDKDYIKNKFICHGKIYRFTPLQSIRINKPQTHFREIPINYGSFKKQWHNPESFDIEL